jgi:hypothetical protein
VKTTLNLSDDLLREAKKRAAEEGTTLTFIVEDALRRALTERGPTLNEVRWIVVDGGPPEVDIADRDALYTFLERAD